MARSPSLHGLVRRAGVRATWLQCVAVDIEEFYDADPRRRSSAELELGTDWRDADGVRYELSWVEDTGELYVMREPAPAGWATPFGGIHVRGAHARDEQELEGMTVAVVGRIETRDEVEQVLAGWQAAMESAEGIAWVAAQLRRAGVLAEDASSGPDAATT